MIPADASLQRAIDSIELPEILVAHRVISVGDEEELLAEEASAFASSVAKVRRASGAGRILARKLLVRLGHTPSAVPKGPTGAPIWPLGVVGSLSHDAVVAVAAVALQRNIAALGIDIEPAESLPVNLLDIVATPYERLRVCNPYDGRLLFAAKEAVYKAVYPLDQTFLDYHDIQINVAHHSALVNNGRTLELRFCISTHLIVLAFIRA
jgi:4'-phosphopantetheinyl transferase EntD